MTRRLMLLLTPVIALAQSNGTWGDPQAVHDDWQEFQKVWNPFANKLNSGVFDVKLWPQVQRAFNSITGCKCRVKN